MPKLQDNSAKSSGGGGPLAGGTGNPGSVGPRRAAGGEGVPADAGGDVLFSRDTFFLQLLLDMVVSDMVLLLWL